MDGALDGKCDGMLDEVTFDDGKGDDPYAEGRSDRITGGPVVDGAGEGSKLLVGT